MALEKVAEQYFKDLNPMASRIYSDLQDTKEAYEDLWTNLSEEEKDQILNEIQDEYDLDIVLDDSFRDEHSAPFSFRTRSQKNLAIFTETKPVKKSNVTKKKSAAPPPPKPRPISHYAQDLDLEDISHTSTQVTQDFKLPKTGLDFLDNW
ncbi:hypothetical protein GWI33_014577 [Rhynchophorus ferrugineus]|uniref:DUF4706 domain-containing protein n=1 Tax=Rhynchophorus ferrugineus TaxID=354439 RepID=A0A834I1D7_RHYFE|nr:hypothetical protein GWI33_014577 [Rhynchophorus ferrugineus]